ncbi:acyltransferase [Mucilaginibacter terrae]|uniref:Surface polysaccharide O-acyltransferase-like enzyme n=1 Tax=Mucilaginibacter terrae TaxID=1955052 RepID=A0ABU3GRS3_9SPHI|nr:acyltransferase [Mucilaginibacter terrae]MDT3402473.1 surface polysaccharide O-acyltransferase-like enzyme [Mucilaginibacter terrae]
MNQPLPAANTTANSRSASLDILKVISIIAVVFIHGNSMIKFNPTAFDISHQGIKMWADAFRFCVPVFIFLWAFFAEKSLIKKGSGSSFSRFFKLLIPFLFWSAVYFFLLGKHKGLNIVSIISKYWVGYGWSGQYYFIILFQLLLLFPLISKITRPLVNRPVVLYVISLVFFVAVSYSGWLNINIVGKISDRAFVYWLPYVVLGIAFAHNKDAIFKVPVWLAVISVVLMPLEVYLHPEDASPYLFPSVFVVAMLIANSAFSHNLTYNEINRGTGNVIQNIAQNTLGIFCINPLIIAFFPRLTKLGELSFAGCSIILPILSTIIVTAVSCLIIYILKRVKLAVLVAN